MFYFYALILGAFIIITYQYFGFGFAEIEQNNYDKKAKMFYQLWTKIRTKKRNIVFYKLVCAFAQMVIMLSCALLATEFISYQLQANVLSSKLILIVFSIAFIVQDYFFRTQAIYNKNENTYQSLIANIFE